MIAEYRGVDVLVHYFIIVGRSDSPARLKLLSRRWGGPRAW